MNIYREDNHVVCLVDNNILICSYIGIECVESRTEDVAGGEGTD